jgi:hypothetical protein
MVAKSAEYLVSYGKSAALARFLSATAEPLLRGDRVVLQSDRGLTLGTVLCEATDRQARLLAAGISGQLLRRADATDLESDRDRRPAEERLFDAATRLAAELGLALEVLDVELALDGRCAILQVLTAPGCDATALVERVAVEQRLEVWLENLAGPASETDHHAHGGCGKPDCGKGEGGGCSSCGSGGCSSCGSGLDLRPYFAHLREQMDERRTPLL